MRVNVCARDREAERRAAGWIKRLATRIALEELADRGDQERARLVAAAIGDKMVTLVRSCSSIREMRATADAWDAEPIHPGHSPVIAVIVRRVADAMERGELR